ncbi:hypothetical protein BN175_2350002 [Clostridioides difficile T23]|nr:hypothetical protein BN169_900114 [Clostridioides difficile E16]CCL35811.1 hypothetical protein BN175_2350002 [Clostridioides difficile T23]
MVFNFFIINSYKSFTIIFVKSTNTAITADGPIYNTISSSFSFYIDAV